MCNVSMMKRVLGIAAGEAAYQTIKANDPNRPVIVIDRGRPEITDSPEDYWQHSDGVWVDRYPIPSTRPTAEGIVSVYREHELVREAVPNKNIGSVLQGFDQRIFHPDNAPNDPMTAENIRPTPEQLRAQLHLSISSGSAITTFYWAPSHMWSLPDDSPDQWQAYIDMGKEVEHLRNAVISPDTVPEYDLNTRIGTLQRSFTDADVDIQHWVRSHDGAVYMGIVNPGGWAKDDSLGWTDEVGVDIEMDWAQFEQINVVRDDLTVAMVRGENGQWQIDTAAFDGMFEDFDGQTLRMQMDFADTVVFQLVPEPGALTVLAVGFGGLLARWRPRPM